MVKIDDLLSMGSPASVRQVLLILAEGGGYVGQVERVLSAADVEQILHPAVTEPGTVAVEAVGQCWPEWKSRLYNASGGTKTFCQAGCLVVCNFMIARSAGYQGTLVEFAEAIQKAGAFSGNYLQHPSRVTAAVPVMRWRYDGWLPGGNSSLIQRRNKALEVDLLLQVLEVAGPVIAEVDYTPLVTSDESWHFVVLLPSTYSADSDPLLDDIMVADPVSGQVVSLVEMYYRPEWRSQLKSGVTRVGRTITGLRVYDTRVGV